MFVGFLSSAGSTTLMYKTAQARANARQQNKIALQKLVHAGYVVSKHRDGVPTFFITEEGKQALHHAYERGNALAQQQKWDGEWRMLSYDFPNDARSLRNSLRYILERAGFLQVQKSVWVFPYDNNELLALLKREPKVQECVIAITGKSAELDRAYKKHFRLA